MWSRVVVTASRWWEQAAAVWAGVCMRVRSEMACAAQCRRRRRRAGVAHRIVSVSRTNRRLPQLRTRLRVVLTTCLEMSASAPTKPPRCLTQPSRAASPKHGHAGEPGTWAGIHRDVDVLFFWVTR